MKRFRLSLALASAACILFSVSFGYGFSTEAQPLVLSALGIGIAVMAAVVWNLVRKAMQQTRTFVKSLEMKDFTLKLPKTLDKEMAEINDSMNRILTLYRDNTNALEVRKLYYDRILRIMTHELRNGITPIVSLSDDMLSHPGRYEGENLREALGLIADESRGIKRFLDSYYELTHLPKPEIVKVDATEFFHGIQKTFSLEIKKAGLPADAVVFTVASGLSLNIDPDMMRQVIMNLLRNALRAVENEKEPSISVMASFPERHPYITVSDNGCGMPEHVLENIFQPFFTTKPDGNGIGLCLSRQIVRLHKGDILVSSTPSHGSSFRISLP